MGSHLAGWPCQLPAAVLATLLQASPDERQAKDLAHVTAAPKGIDHDTTRRNKAQAGVATMN